MSRRKRHPSPQESTAKMSKPSLAQTEESHFIIQLGRDADPVRYRVRIYLPKNRKKPTPGLEPGMTCSRSILERLVEMLNPDHISTEPTKKENLVKKGASRIDTQSATDKFRNIQFQLKSDTFANVTIDHGGQLCMYGNYDKKLLKYIIFGLNKSFEDRTIYNSRVTIAFKEGKSSYWKPSVDGTKELAEKIVTAYSKRIERNRKNSVQWREKRAKNTLALKANTEKKKSKEAAGTSVSTLSTRGIESDSMETSRSLEDIGDTKIDELKTENNYIREELAKHFRESDIFGRRSDKYFDESEFADLEDITKIKIGAGYMINWIQVIYPSREAPKHGGNLGREDELVLEEDERIITVNVTISSDRIGVSSLTFYTDNGREKSFGKVEGTGYEFEMTDGCYLAAIKGFDANVGGSHLPAIGFIQKA